jgi:hypothetical protein
MMLADLRTAAEVREHARIVQRRINAQRAAAARAEQERKPPPPMPAPRPPKKPRDDVPAPCLSELPLHPSAVPVPVAISGHPTRTVLSIAADYFGFALTDLIGECRTQAVVLPRQIGCFVAHRLGASYLRIGRAAERNHATVMHACKLIEKRIAEDEAVAIAVNAIGVQAAEVFKAR